MISPVISFAGQRNFTLQLLPKLSKNPALSLYKPELTKGYGSFELVYQ